MISVKDQFYIDKSKIDDNDKRQIEWLLELEREVPEDW